MYFLHMEEIDLRYIQIGQISIKLKKMLEFTHLYLGTCHFGVDGLEIMKNVTIV